MNRANRGHLAMVTVRTMTCRNNVLVSRRKHQDAVVFRFMVAIFLGWSGKDACMYGQEGGGATPLLRHEPRDRVRDRHRCRACPKSRGR